LERREGLGSFHPDAAVFHLQSALPWKLVSDAISAALKAHFLEIAD
jgi:hypothetical protein